MTTPISPPKNYPVTEELNGDPILTEPWHGWCLQVSRGLMALQASSAAGYSGTVTLAKITGGRTDGSLTVVNGLITSVTAPT